VNGPFTTWAFATEGRNEIPIRKIPRAEGRFNFLLILFGLLKMDSVQTKFHSFGIYILFRDI
jgi:hypothetical protein